MYIVWRYVDGDNTITAHAGIAIIVGMGIVLGVMFGLMLLAIVAVVMNICRYGILTSH